MYKKTCRTCGKNFESEHEYYNYCSWECRQEAQEQNTKDKKGGKVRGESSKKVYKNKPVRSQNATVDKPVNETLETGVSKLNETLREGFKSVVDALQNFAAVLDDLSIENEVKDERENEVNEEPQEAPDELENVSTNEEVGVDDDFEELQISQNNGSVQKVDKKSTKSEEDDYDFDDIDF